MGHKINFLASAWQMINFFFAFIALAREPFYPITWFMHTDYMSLQVFYMGL